MKYITICIAGGLILLAAIVHPAFSAAIVTVSPSGASSYSIEGLNFQGVAAVELAISYDPAALSNPRILQGTLVSGSLIASNMNVPGNIRTAMIRTAPIQGSGPIASVAFDQKGAGPGKITAVSARLANINGAGLPVQVRLENPVQPEPANQPGQQTASVNPVAGASVPATPQVIPAIIPVLTQPGQEPGRSESKRRTESSGTAGELSGHERSEVKDRDVQADSANESANKAAPDKDNAKKRSYTEKSVLERFREYRGERTLSAMASLFYRDSMIGFRQAPAVALSDGKTPVTVSVISAGDRRPDDIAVLGARVLSIRKDPENSNTWLVRLMPESGTWQASLAIVQNEIRIIYPLTVAPKADAGLEKYLEGRQGPGGGKREYLKDYVYTANYLAGRR